MPAPRLLGIVNITEDSFSDGGRYLDPAAALGHAHRLVTGGADIVDLGAAASNVAAARVSAETEIHRLAPVLRSLKTAGVPLSVDSFRPAVQRFALREGIAYLNDIRGFPDASLYPELAAASCRLIVMHAVWGTGPDDSGNRDRAQLHDVEPDSVWDRIRAFFAERVTRLERAGIAPERLILDPGMGFFLSTRPEASLRALAGIPALKREFGLPVLISVSRKSFLGAITGQADRTRLGPATLAAELFAARQGADFIRTHDPAALCDALRVTEAAETVGDVATARE